jgi:hypothetical protein
MRTARVILLVAVFSTMSLCVSASGQHISRNLSDLPIIAQAGISAALGRDIPAYYAHPAGGGFEAANPSQELIIDFTSQGIEVRNRDARWRMTLRGYGYGAALNAVETVAPTVSLNRVQYWREGITEWYVNGPVGLEQGFTVDRPSGQANGQLLTIALALSGNLTAIDDGRKGLLLTTPEKQTKLRYPGVSARDATGRDLPASLEVEGERMLLQVADAGARYPLVIDPWLQLAKLTASDGQTGDAFGYSVAISGNTVVVGAPAAAFPFASGAAYVFVKAASGWTNMTETAKLTASDGSERDSLGYSVAIDGNTVVAGAPRAQIGSNFAQGAAYVFVKPASGWADMTETAKLTAFNGAEEDALGTSVSISGNTVVVGAPYGTSSHEGAIYLFAKGTNGWSTRSHSNAELTPSNRAAFDEFGWSAAISGDTVAAGAPAATVDGDLYRGAVYVFVKPGAGWHGRLAPTSKLTASDGQRGDRLGFSVSVSGNTVVGGAYQATVGCNRAQGAAFVFVKPLSGWAKLTTQTAKLTARDHFLYGWFGYSVFVSDDRVVVGAPNASVNSETHQGAAYVFVKPRKGWRTTSKFQSKLTAFDGQQDDNLGWSVTASRDAAVAGAPGLDANAEHQAAYVFGR